MQVEEFSGLGSGGSDFWLGTGFGSGCNGSGGSSDNVGTLSVQAGWSFRLNSFDAWMGQDDGDNFFASADVKFIGTLIDSSIVEVVLTINTPDNFNFDLNRSFAGTALENTALTSLGFELVTAGALNYMALDNLALDVRQSSPPNTVPEPLTIALMGLGLAGLGIARRKQR